MNEGPVQSRVRLLAAEMGLNLYRNNVGACTDETGRLVRYGLANESAEMNRHIKSSDLIGFTPVVVTPEMVGRVVAIFTAVECKASNWHMKPGDERAIAQERFHAIVQKHGGFAGFATHPDDLKNILRWI